MNFEKRIHLAGSERTPVPGSTHVGPVNSTDHVQVTVILHRSTTGVGAPPTDQISHEEFGKVHGADPADIQMVEEFAHEYELTVIESSAAKRSVVLSGTAQQMERAFDAAMALYELPGQKFKYRGRTGTLSLPEALHGKVMAVLGMDCRPVAKPHFRINAHAPSANPPAGTFTPPQVAALYNFPAGLTGAGQTIGIIELGGGYKTADLKTYFKSIGVTQPKVTAISVDGGKNTPGSDADGEVMLDIEVAGAIAHGANIAVYFAPNTDQGFVDAITNSVHDKTRKPSVVSISWGGSEDDWTPQARDAMNSALQDAATLGVTVTVASGDNGSSDGATDGKLHVDFPASSPYSLACGGTKLTGSGTKITSEVVWNEDASKEGSTGGGVSKFFALPSYQTAAKVPAQPETKFVGRGVPDVSGDADPTTGYFIRYDGKNGVVGGTSAVAPLWAALIALVNQKKGKAVGFINPAIYQHASAFYDITQGSNGHYSAGPGWDACTGLGSPNGASVLTALSAAVTK